LRFDPVHAVEREFSVVGCHAFADELPWAIELLERNTSAFLPLISHRISLEDVPREFEKIAGGAAQGIKTLIDIGS
ncbi:MAG: dehydrogenase, partial [Pseudomonadota bacterium]